MNRLLAKVFQECRLPGCSDWPAVKTIQYAAIHQPQRFYTASAASSLL
ncbi:hypothetical protein [Pseudomonas solani]